MSENQLHSQKSLYLKQHAENPINWFPFSQEILNQAKDQKKLIFLSIGYSSCHWCHVMAHESFEDQNTADFLNEHFLSIKIDREEYPDIDHYYQKASSIMNGQGGWPLSVFLTPEGKVFFIGTYFPKEGRQGLPSFMDVLKELSKVWHERPEELITKSNKLTELMTKPYEVQKRVEYQGHFPPPSAILNALKNYADKENGGYGKAPKFPHFAFFEWASEQILEGMIPQELGQHIVDSIEKMMMGGIYDHAKGGIHRYSVDEKYLVPHFEKMLYDQAGLLKVLSKLSQFYPSPLVFDGLLQTLDYLRSEMLADENYFFASQDADSEGTEGLYFTYTKEEFEESFEHAPPEQKIKIDQYLEWFNISKGGNFEHGLNVLSLNQKFKSDFYQQDGWQEVRDIRRRLLEARKLRFPPATDRKGISSWNYLVISSLCDVVQYCPLDVIQNQAFDLINNVIQGCDKEFIRIDDSEKHILKHTNTLEHENLYLEDYVSFTEAQLRIYEITGNDAFKKNALTSVNFILKKFVKEQKIFQTSVDEKKSQNFNIEAPLYDQSYRSSATAFLHLLFRLSVFDPSLSPSEVFKDELSNIIQLILTNPLGHGEGLRAMIYPSDVFRKVEVPLAWVNDEEFRKVRSHFFSRFVMDYHHEEDDSFQICTTSSCEISGKGIEEFKAVFKADQPQPAKG